MFIALLYKLAEEQAVVALRVKLQLPTLHIQKNLLFVIIPQEISH
jgi:hypothetical protein